MFNININYVYIIDNINIILFDIDTNRIEFSKTASNIKLNRNFQDLFSTFSEILIKDLIENWTH